MECHLAERGPLTSLGSCKQYTHITLKLNYCYRLKKITQRALHLVEQATHVFSYLRGESPFLTPSQCSIVQFWFLYIQKDLSFQTSCNLKDNIIAFKSLSPSGLHVVFLTLIPYSFHLFKGLHGAFW